MSTLNNITTQIDSIKTDIVTSHTNLKNALIGKGVEILPTDKMSSLIEQVKNIALGKKWASGKVAQSGSSRISFNYTRKGYESSDTEMMYSVIISGLNFVPSILILSGTSSYGVAYCSILYNFKSDYYSKTVKCFKTDGAGSSSTYCKDFRADSKVISASKITMPVEYGIEYEWIAVE